MTNVMPGAYAMDKFRFNRWGKQKIERMLRQKQIAEHIVAGL